MKHGIGLNFQQDAGARGRGRAKQSKSKTYRSYSQSRGKDGPAGQPSAQGGYGSWGGGGALIAKPEPLQG